MKNLITLLLLAMSFNCNAQENKFTESFKLADSLIIGSGVDFFRPFDSSTAPVLKFQKWEPTSFTIHFNDLQRLEFTAKGDSLIATGNLKPNKAAEQFLKWSGVLYLHKMDSLRKELEKCKSSKQ